MGTGELLRAWEFPPGLVAWWALFPVLYLVGWRRLRGAGRGRQGAPAWRAWAFLSGMALLGLALFSPLDALSERSLTLHMAQHMLLAIGVPPLVWLGHPLPPIMLGLPRTLRVGLGRLIAPAGTPGRALSWLAAPLPATVVFLALLGVWHFPTLYDAAQGPTLVHDAEHLSMLAAGLLWWWPLVHPGGGRRRLGLAPGLLYLLPPVLVMSIIGAVLTFSSYPVYATYREAVPPWGLTPLEDQRLGGLVMWMPAKAVLIITMAVLFFRISAREEAREPAWARDPRAGETTRGEASP